MNTHDINNTDQEDMVRGKMGTSNADHRAETPDEYVLEEGPATSSDSYILEGADGSSESYVLDEGDVASDSTTPNTKEGNSKSQDENMGKTKKRLSPFRIMLLTLTNSTEGWKALRRAGYTNEEVASRLFYPMSALAAVSTFAQLIFDSFTPISEVVVHGLVVFVSFFLGNFVAHLLQQWLMPKSAKEFVKSEFCQQLNMISLSTLAMFYAVTAWIPLLEPVFFFLPLWTIYALVRASKFISCDDDKRSLTLTLLCLTIIASPWIVEAAADAFLPK